MIGGELPQELIVQIQRHTNAPWWNGKAYDEFHGISAGARSMAKAMGDAVDDIADVMDWLREEGQFDKADRLRTIAGRLAKGVDLKYQGGPPDLIRNIAKGWK